LPARPIGGNRSGKDDFPATFLKFSEGGIPPTAVTSFSLAANS